MKKSTIKAGDKYNKLTAIKFNHRNKRGDQHWLFRCDCKKEKVIYVSNVKNGNVKSCGCLKKGNNLKHKMCETRVYSSWIEMKRRCLNKNCLDYKNYGSRGITFCSKWLKFENFYKDMGDRPVNKTLDRRDNSGNYCKENCRWATLKEQSNNTRTNHLLTFGNKTKTIAQWSEESGINYSTLYYRISKGWNIEKALLPKADL